jgi:hypothetical protein
MSVISPSAQAITMQPEMRPARNGTKPAAPQTANQASSLRQPLRMTEAQKRWKLAQDGFGDVMALAYKSPDAFGFMADEDLRSVTLGEAVPVYTVVHLGRMGFTNQPVQSLLKPAGEWVYPIILANHIRFMVEVRYDGHDYVLGHGSRALAVDYDKIVVHWPAGEGFHPQLVILPDQPFYYFTIPELPDQNLTDTSRMLDFNLSLTPAQVILAGWR